MNFLDRMDCGMAVPRATHRCGRFFTVISNTTILKVLQGHQLHDYRPIANDVVLQVVRKAKEREAFISTDVKCHVAREQRRAIISMIS